MSDLIEKFTTFVGVDVAKKRLDIAVDQQLGCLTIENAEEQIAKWCETLDNESTFVVMEGTGGYEARLVQQLHQHGVAVVVVNPRQVRDFAKGIGHDAKTDPIDASCLATIVISIGVHDAPLIGHRGPAAVEVVRNLHLIGAAGDGVARIGIDRVGHQTDVVVVLVENARSPGRPSRCRCRR